jgi:hypothetical protein
MGSGVEMIPNPADPLFDLVEGEIWTARGSSGFVEVFLACYW